MILDREGHEIVLSDIPNPHILITGKSGCGKTYLCTQLIAEEYRNRQKVLVLDASNSYSPEELRRNQAHFVGNIQYQDPNKRTVFFPLRTADAKLAAEKVAAALQNAFEIDSYHRKGIILECCKHIFRNKRYFSFTDLITVLQLYEKCYMKEKDLHELLENVRRLINRFNMLCQLETFVIVMQEPAIDMNGGQIEIMQISNLPDSYRDALATFLLELIWGEIRENRGYSKFDTLLLDEFQNFSLKKGSALYSMLREGRKFGLRLILSSQYLNGRDTDKLNALLQVGTIFFFAPTDRDLPAVSKILDEKYDREWRSCLKSLQRGEAVLNANYRIKGRQHLISDPLLVRIN